MCVSLGSLGTFIIFPPCYVGGQQFSDCWFKADSSKRAWDICEVWWSGMWSFVSFAFPWAAFLPPSLPISSSLWMSSGGTGCLWLSFCSWFTEVRLAPGCLSFKPEKFHIPSIWFWQPICAPQSAGVGVSIPPWHSSALCSLPSSQPVQRATIPWSWPAKSDPCPVLSLVLPQGKWEKGKASQEQAALFAGPAALSILLEPKQKMVQQDLARANTRALQWLLQCICHVLPLPFQLQACISPAWRRWLPSWLAIGL